MARITVEDCRDIIPDRFKLVAIASRRARDIASGAQITLERNNDKDAVVALREIAEKKISPEEVTEEIISSYQRTSYNFANDSEISEKTKQDLREITGQSVDDMKGSSNPSATKIAEGMFSDDNIAIED